MNSLRLTVNGASVTQAVEPRTSLADLLRENLHLTGTHLGCEQGVCGACTVIVDGVPVRSCISNATGCGGAEVRTIEDFVEKAALPSARDLFRCGRYAHEGELKRRAVTSATERALRLGFDSATDLRKWKWRLKESAKADARLSRFAEQIDGLDPLLADGRDW